MSSHQMLDHNDRTAFFLSSSPGDEVHVLDKIKYIEATDISSPSQNGRQIPVSWQNQPVGGHHKNQNCLLF